MGVSDKTPKAPIRKISAKVKETKVRIMVTTTKRVNRSDMGTNCDNNYNQNNYGNRNESWGPYVPLKSGKLP